MQPAHQKVETFHLDEVVDLLETISSLCTCLMRPFFLGPRQMTASSFPGRRKPMDMTPRLSSTYTGLQPLPLLCTSSPSRPIILRAIGLGFHTCGAQVVLLIVQLLPRSCAHYGVTDCHGRISSSLYVHGLYLGMEGPHMSTSRRPT